MKLEMQKVGYSNRLTYLIANAPVIESYCQALGVIHHSF